VWAGAPRVSSVELERDRRWTRRPLMAAWAAVLGIVVLLLPQTLTSLVTARTLARADAAEPAQRLALLEAAVRGDARSAEAALLLGLGELELGMPARATAHLERARSLRAAVGTEIGLGNAQLELGRVEQAIESYRRALGLHPGSFRAHANLGEALRRAMRLDEAERELAAARTLQPGHPKLAQLAEQLRRTRIEQATTP